MELDLECKFCQQPFQVVPEDLDFYQRLQVPPPTWCPTCRLQRRMAFTNERNLFRRPCSLCKKDMISLYHPETEFPVYCKECWWSDSWDATQFGTEYDFSQPFFSQFYTLKKQVPRLGLIQEGNMEGSEYTNRAANNKNCYLCFRSTLNEDSMYSQPIVESKDSLDGYNIAKCEITYDCVDCLQCYNVQFSQESQNCQDSKFLLDCRDCSNCFGCVGLRSKEYHIFNQPVPKEIYSQKVQELYDGSYSSLQRFIPQWKDFKLKFPMPSMVTSRSEGSSGNWIYESTNAQQSIMARKVENGKYLFFVTDAKDCMDFFHFGRGCQQVYETGNCGLDCTNIKFCNEVFVSNANLTYCDGVFSSSDCFGSVGLRKKQYCILNKQYSKEEYESLVQKIVDQMKQLPYTDKSGRQFGYGEFFPAEFSPVGYNETAAQEFFPLTKEQALSQGFTWQDSLKRDFTPTLLAADLPDLTSEASSEISKQVIACQHCSGVYKILAPELSFYQRVQVPLPRLCPNCRHAERLQLRTGIHFFNRSCQCVGSVSVGERYANQAIHDHGTDPCRNTFETSYQPDQPEIVYCLSCYQAEKI